MRWCHATIIGLVVLSAVPLDAGESLTVDVTPAVALAPAIVHVRATVEADSANRAIRVVAESADFYRSSEMPLEGRDAPRITVVKFSSLPEGIYRVTVMVLGADGRTTAMQHRTFICGGKE